MAFGIRGKPTRVAIDDALDGNTGAAGETYLDAGSVLTGELRFAGSVRLEGRVEGEIHTAGIVVEEGASFKGCILIGHEASRSAPAHSAADVPSLAAVRAEPT